MKTLTEPDFERLTAFALNELDAGERASIEAQLKNDPEAQAYVNDVRATALTLENELKQERLEDLARVFSPVVKAAPVAAVAPREVIKPRSNLFAYCASAAAMVMLGVVIWQGSAVGNRPEKQLALQDSARMSNKKIADPLVLVSPVTVSEQKAKSPEGLKPVTEATEINPAKTTPAPISLPVGDSHSASGSADAKKVSDAPAPEKVPQGLEAKKEKDSEADKKPASIPEIKLDRSDDVYEVKKPIAPVTPTLPPIREAKVYAGKIDEKKEAEIAKLDGAKTPPGLVPSEPAKAAKKFDPNEPETISGLDPSTKPQNEASRGVGLFPSGGGPEVTTPPHVTKLEGNPNGLSKDELKDSLKSHNGKIQQNYAVVPPTESDAVDLPAAKAIDPTKPPVLLLHPRLDPNFPKKDPDLSDTNILRYFNAEEHQKREAEKARAGKDKVEIEKGVKDDFKKTPEQPAQIHGSWWNNATPESGKKAEIGGKPDWAGGSINGSELAMEERARKESDARYALVDKSRDDHFKKGLVDELPAAKTPAPASKPNEVSVSEWEAMKAELAKLREQVVANPPVPGLVDTKTGTINDNDHFVINGNIEGYRQPTTQPGGETYAIYPENAFKSVRHDPLSTFSADVDTASYSNVRRFLNNNQLPPVDAVRVEEMLNYFKYNVDTLKTEGPFGVNVEGAACPWNASTRLVRVAIKAAEMPNAQRPASNIVFLIDVSGSMDDPKRLPLVKDGMKALVKRLNANDRVAIVTYAGESGVALSPTSGADHDRIIAVIDSLRAAGGTNGGAGIQLAYASARGTFIKGGVNRVILATDGDFNIGTTSTSQLVDYVASQTPAGVYLTALGYGMGNLKDEMLQRLADKGNGNYAYIDTAEESRKVLIDQMAGTLVTVAKDVKFQVEFNPSQAAAYRLIGYEKRAMAAADFNNDAKDAGDVGAGHTVTAFYEVVPANAVQPAGVDPLKYQTGNVNVETKPEPVKASPELLTLKIRFKQPDANESRKLEFAFTDKGASFEQATTDFKFASAVALFGQILKNSNKVQLPYMRRVIEIADENRGTDEGGYRREFIQLARKAGELRGER